MPMLISLWSVLRELRFLRPLVFPLSLLLICVTTSWTSCKVSSFLLLPRFPWGRSQSVLPPPAGELPLPVPSILFLLLMLSFPIYSQGNPLPALRKPQDSNTVICFSNKQFVFRFLNVQQPLHCLALSMKSY